MCETWASIACEALTKSRRVRVMHLPLTNKSGVVRWAIFRSVSDSLKKNRRALIDSLAEVWETYKQLIHNKMC